MTKAELVLDTLFLSNTVSTQYKAIDILRNLNMYYDEIVLEIFKSDATWKYDEGVGTLPTIIANLIQDQRDYQLPTEARRIERVEIKDSNGKWHILTPISPDKSDEENDDTGTPNKYYVKGRSIFIFPLSNENREEALSVTLSKSVTQLVEDTDEPKIDREFQRYLTIGAAYDWYFAKGNISKSREMERRLEKLKMAVKDFYSKRNEDYVSKFSVKKENYK
jgi:hypothetical protein